jgi:hypothetical protein
MVQFESSAPGQFTSPPNPKVNPWQPGRSYFPEPAFPDSFRVANGFWILDCRFSIFDFRLAIADYDFEF